MHIIVVDVVARHEVVVVHDAEDGEGTLRVGRVAVPVMFAVGSRADVLVEALRRAHAVVQQEDGFEGLAEEAVEGQPAGFAQLADRL